MSARAAEALESREGIIERRGSALGRPIFLGAAFLALAASGATLFGVASAHWVLLAGVAVLLLLIGVGVWWQASGIFGRPLLGVATPWPELALTFDDGPNPEQTPAILDALAARGHRATFFVIGQNAERHPELLAEIVRRGHSLANHSFAHAAFTNLRHPRLLAQELRRTSALLSQAAGRPSRFFRPPVGLLSPRVSRAALLADLDLVGWSASARDGAPWRTAEQGFRRLAPHLVPGAILVLHDGARPQGKPGIALPILEQVLRDLERRGLQSVTLERLLRV